MSFGACGFLCLMERPIPPIKVFLLRNLLKMFWITAMPNSTKMVEHHAVFHFSINGFIDNPMNFTDKAAQLGVPIPFAYTTSPKPA